MPGNSYTSVRSRTVASELRKLREKTGLSCAEVAKTLGVSSSKISRMETGVSGLQTDDVATLLVDSNGWNLNASNFFSAIGAYAGSSDASQLNGLFNSITYSVVGSGGSADGHGQPQDGTDVFFGGDHPDVFNGLPGPFGPSDNGSDTVDYSHATSGVTVNLPNGAINGNATSTAGGDAAIGNDTLIGVNWVRGSEFADVLTRSELRPNVFFKVLGRFR